MNNTSPTKCAGLTLNYFECNWWFSHEDLLTGVSSNSS
jgi:hypothetical protein